ncbi:MAG: MFS transporter [Hyphomicrobiales bacterium]
MIKKLKPVGGIATLFVGSLLFQIVQVGAFPILLSQLLSAWGTDSFTIGVFVAISWVVVFAAGPFVPRLITTLGSRHANSLAFVCTLSGLMFLLLPISFLGVFAASVAMGLGLIVRWVNCDTLVVHLSDDQVRGRTIGFHEALMGLGIGLGPLLFVLPNMDWVIWTCICIVLVGQLAFLFTNTVLSDQVMAADRLPFSKRILLRAISMALVAALIAGFIENSSIALLPLYFENVNFSLGISAILVSSFGFGGTLLQPALGYLADRQSYFFAQMVCVVTIIVGGIIIYVFAGVFVVSLIALFFLGGAAGGLNTLAVIEAGNHQENTQIPAAMTAIAMFYTLGSIVGPVASGAVLDAFNGQGMMALFILVGALLGGGLFAHRNGFR